MKLTPLARAMLLASALLATVASARADITDYSGYTTNNYFTDSINGNIAAFDWDSSNNLYYTTGDSSTSDFNGLYIAGNPNALFGGNTAYEGSSVVALGGNIYFNDGNEVIYNYNPITTSTGSTTAIQNWGLYKQSGQLFITGSGASTNNAISYSSIGTGGALTAPTVIESDNNYSGPLDFDATGDLFYAPGASSGTSSIFEWSAAQVSAALAHPAANGLTIDSGNASTDATLWDAYGSIYSSYAGGTSLVIDNNQLFLTLTNYGGPSALVSFGIATLDGTNTYNGISNLILTDDASTGNSLGQLGLNNGNLYVADGNQILEVAPEPSTYLLLAVGLAGLVFIRSRRAKRLAPAAALIASSFFFR